MVHPDFQRRGLLAAMTRLANARMAARGWQFIVNFTGEVLYSTYLKLGHHHLFDLEHYGAVSRAAMIRRVAHRLSPGPAADRATFDARFDDLWQRTADCHGVTQVRDRAYLSWRYEQRPDRRYSLITAEEDGVLRGFAIVRGPFVVDLWGEDDPAVSASLLQQSLQRIRRSGEALAALVVAPGAAKPAILARVGLRREEPGTPPCLVPRQPVTFLTVDPALQAQLAAADWYVTMGDSDWF
jgi:hypothetical protein